MQEAKPSVEDLALALHEYVFTQPQERFANQPWDLVKAIESFAQNKRMMIFELSPVSAQVARDLIHLAGLEDLVRVLEGPAAESLKKLHIEGKVKPRAVDMAFFDHWEKFYLPDLQLCEDLNLFHRGSLVIADNTDFPGAPDYLAYVKAGGRGEKGAVRYDSQSLKAVAQEGHPKKIVEVSTVVDIDA